MSLRVRATLASLWPGLVYLLFCAGHLTLLLRHSALADTTQWLLMPPLIAFLLLNAHSVRSPLVRRTMVALLFSWAGDSLPFVVPDAWEFLTRFALFLGAQISLVLALWSFRPRSILVTRPQLLAPYGIAIVGLVGLCVPGAGPISVGLAAYAVVVTLVSALATGLNAAATWGGILFIVSDGLLAVNQFVASFHVPHIDAVVMLTYLCAQALITLGVLERDRGGRPLRHPY